MIVGRASGPKSLTGECAVGNMRNYNEGGEVMREAMDYIMDLEGNKILIEGEQKRMKQDLADQYVRMRKDMKLTQEQVSRRSGIPRSNIARFESGRYNPSLELMVKMAAAMGLKVQIQLVPDKDAKK